jgi:energy-coupling factor transporter ATP-binding protein EcfA2
MTKTYSDIKIMTSIVTESTKTAKKIRTNTETKIQVTKPETKTATTKQKKDKIKEEPKPENPTAKIQLGKALDEVKPSKCKGYGRHYLITLRPHDDRPFTNAVEEKEKLKEYVESFAGLRYAIIGTEKNYKKLYVSNGKKDKHMEYMKETGTYHYHIMIVTKNSSPPEHLKTVEDELIKLFPEQLSLSEEADADEKSKDNPAVDVKFTNVKAKDRDKVRDPFYYCGKEDLDPLIIGKEMTHEILKNTIKIGKLERKLKPDKYKTPAERDKAVRNFVLNIMKSKCIRVNYITDSFVGKCFDNIPSKDINMAFWKIVIGDGFLDKFSDDDFKRIKKIVFDREGYSSIFPYYKPCLYMFKYLDGYIDIVKGKKLELSDGDKYLKDLDMEPVTEFDEVITYVLPDILKGFFSNFKISEINLKAALREVILPARPDGKSILLYGPTRGGKSTLLSIFQRLFGLSCGILPTDGRFGLSEIKDHEKYVGHEVGHILTSGNREIIDNFKMFLEGSPDTKGKVKHKGGVFIVIKNGIMSCNLSLEELMNMVTESSDAEAMLERLNLIGCPNTIPKEMRRTEYKQEVMDSVGPLLGYLFLNSNPEG